MKPFVKKTSAQIAAMTDAERDTYMADKEQHDAEQAAEALKNAVEDAMKTKVPDAVKTLLKDLETTVEDLKTKNTTLAGQVTKLTEKEVKQTEANPYSSITKELIDAFQEDKSKNANMHFTVKVAGTMTVGNNVSGTTNFNISLEAGIAQAPIIPPLMVQIADVRFVRNPGNGGIPNIGWINKVNPDGNAAITAEGELKPLRDFDLVGESMAVKEIAVRENVGKYMLRDVAEMQAIINKDIRDEMDREADEQFLSGTGGSEMTGIIDYAPAYTDTSLNASVTDANNVDAIIAMALQIELLGWTGALTCVVNPVTYAMIYTFKGVNFRDLVVVTERNGQLYVNNILIKKSLKISLGYCLMGDFSKSHVRIIDDVEVETGYGASTDDFNKNLVTVRADMRALHFVKQVETSAFVYDTLQNVIDAITV